jgi:hypothetical protein
MQVVIPFHSGDAQDALDLLTWMGQLGETPTHKAILAVDAGVEWGHAVELLNAANKVFRYVSILSTDSPVTGWPQGANSLFWKTAEYCKTINEPFLWLEPDCVPLTRDWLSRIHSTYGTQPKDGYLGHIYECNQPGLPHRLLSGIAVYPPSAFDLISPRIGNQPHLAWDVSAAEVILPHATDSTLFHHFWGEKGLAPTFRQARTPECPVSVRTLDHIRKGAVLFHRNKDGSLRRLLGPKLGIAPVTNFVVVLPVCNLDADLMCKQLDWIHALGNSNSHEALLSYDQTTIRGSVSRIVAKASNCFSSVHQTSYRVPKGAQFPQTAAWHHAARVMEGMGRPWLWLEADCVPLKSGWIGALQNEYDRCGKPFCGPIVMPNGHMNGTAIYPADTPRRLPRTMTVLSNAWDVECRDELGVNAYHSNLWCLAWGVDNGRLSPVGGAELPSFPRGSPLLRQIGTHPVLFHRDKTGSLIDRLREK